MHKNIPVDDFAQRRKDDGCPNNRDEQLDGRFCVRVNCEFGATTLPRLICLPADLISSGKRAKMPAVEATIYARRWCWSSTAKRLCARCQGSFSPYLPLD